MGRKPITDRKNFLDFDRVEMNDGCPLQGLATGRHQTQAESLGCHVNAFQAKSISDNRSFEEVVS